MTVGADGVAVILFDCTTRKMNTLTAAGWDALAALVEQIKSDATIRGAVIASGKDNGFCAGADLGEMMGYAGVRSADEATQRAVFDTLFKANRVARAIETCGKPVAAAIGGLALGGGLELALACHYRVVADDAAIRLGLPEATIGLLPGGGGTQRIGRLLGIARAMPLLQEGTSFGPARALELGLIDAVVPKGEELAAAKAWLLADADAIAPWDRKGFVLPGGGPYSESGNAEFIAAAAGVAKSGLGNYPARMNIARAVYEGVQVPMDAAIVIETRYFVATLQTPTARAMIRTQFGSLPALRRGESRPAGFDRRALGKVAVLGAGMMGAGIAYVLAKAGIETVLIDVSLDAAEKGKAYSSKLLDRLVAKGAAARESADATLEADPAERRLCRRRRQRRGDRNCVRGCWREGGGDREGDRPPLTGRPICDQHLDAADRPARGGASRSVALHRHALPFPGGPDGAGRGGDRQGDGSGGDRTGARSRAADRQDGHPRA